MVLPLAALAILATLFLVARRIDPDAAIPIAEVDDEQFARQSRIGAPEFAGVTEDGTVVTLSAEVARPDPARPSRMTAEGFAATFALPGGGEVAARAARGALDTASGELTLDGGVEMTTATGYRIDAPRIDADLTRTEIRSGEGVTAVGPPGRIEAETVVVAEGAVAPGTYDLVFNGGVRLVYEPGDAGGETAGGARD